MWWLVLHGSGACFGYTDDRLMECDPRIAFDIFMYHGYKDYDGADLYAVKPIEVFGDWNLDPIPCPALPIKRYMPHGYACTLTTSAPDAYWKDYQYAAAYVDVAGCTHVYPQKTIEEAKDIAQKHLVGFTNVSTSEGMKQVPNVKQAMVLEIPHQIQVEYS